MPFLNAVDRRCFRLRPRYWSCLLQRWGTKMFIILQSLLSSIICVRLIKVPWVKKWEISLQCWSLKLLLTAAHMCPLLGCTLTGQEADVASAMDSSPSKRCVLCLFRRMESDWATLWYMAAVFHDIFQQIFYPAQRPIFTKRYTGPPGIARMPVWPVRHCVDSSHIDVLKTISSLRPIRLNLWERFSSRM